MTTNASVQSTTKPVQKNAQAQYPPNNPSHVCTCIVQHHHLSSHLPVSIKSISRTLYLFLILYTQFAQPCIPGDLC